MAPGLQSIGRLYGIHPVLEALKAGDRRIERLYLVKGRHGNEIEEIVRLARLRHIPTSFESRGELDRAAGTDKHQGVLARVAVRAYVGIDEILSRGGEGEPSLVIVLDHIEDPRNLGAILRTANAVGAHGVVIPHRRAAGLSEAAAKTSAGALEYVQVAREVNIGQSIARLKDAGLWVFGLDAKRGRLYTEADLRVPLALVAGGEGRGLGPVVRKSCDEILSLPMAVGVSSLNVSVAVAVACYEVLRQRSGSVRK